MFADNALRSVGVGSVTWTGWCASTVILRHLGLPATPSPLSLARRPPQHDLDFEADQGLDIDQTPAYHLTEPEPIPDFDFDRELGRAGIHEFVNIKTVVIAAGAGRTAGTQSVTE